eukprot:scaffold14_cov130-Cylindrotheca_fusiformis.AAC.4
MPSALLNRAKQRMCDERMMRDMLGGYCSLRLNLHHRAKERGVFVPAKLDNEPEHETAMA